MRYASRLAALEKRQRQRRTGVLSPVAVLHHTMIDALEWTPEERTRLVYRATDAELVAWGLRQKRGGA